MMDSVEGLGTGEQQSSLAGHLPLARPTRRAVLSAGALAIITTVGDSATGQVAPTGLRLVRRSGWQDWFLKSQCIAGDLYAINPSFPMSDLGSKVCNILELAYRNNLSQISAIPLGIYEGFIRMDGPRGWRIELKGTAPRENIQVHVGNRLDDTVGCLLAGKSEVSLKDCRIESSKEAMADLRARVGDSITSKVVLKIQV